MMLDNSDLSSKYLDFVKYCEAMKLTASPRRQRRRQRQSMSRMMGFSDVNELLFDAVNNFEVTLDTPQLGGAMEYMHQKMARHIARIGSLEEQLKVMPALWLQIDILTEEKRRLESRQTPCTRDVGCQSAAQASIHNSTSTEVPSVATKECQWSPIMDTRAVQTLDSVVHNVTTLTDPDPVSEEPSKPVIELYSQSQQTNEMIMANARVQTDIPQSHNKAIQTVTNTLSATTQTEIEEWSTKIVCESTESEKESVKSPLSAINEDSERETYSSVATCDIESYDDELIVLPSREMLSAVESIGDALERETDAYSLAHVNAMARREWFHVASTESANAGTVRAYLAAFEAHSTAVLTYMITLADANGNTALHYAISHGNFAVVEVLLESGSCDVNRCNNAGYTAIMLASLVPLQSLESRSIVERLFQHADVNVRARKHGQTALMLAVSHGNTNMVALLLAAGADVNAQDEDGSTALMCAVEHGKMDIVKILLAQPNCDSSIQDMDGSTALKISLDAGYHDIGILLYAHGRAVHHRNIS
ncbi:KN motif and ankyrin repeat domain-containing protein 2 isoform X2 [Phlebotomus argentipes]|uniref:KN motif and ankyrin repeat domain-containing protein 2 isoform X2 n=1 Tax=Phlebotomus argentipes TaxID=94469 RepID=UPI0028930B86|nr:KN motif and ankyrin repeat domain-containing protein 2 isoform X2 [Phlebotomus argentipes]